MTAQSMILVGGLLIVLAATGLIVWALFGDDGTIL